MDRTTYEFAKKASRTAYEEAIRTGDGGGSGGGGPHTHEEYANKTHTHPPQDLNHSHNEYFPSGGKTDEDGNEIPPPYPDANALGEAVDKKADAHSHPYVNNNKDTAFPHTSDYKWTKLISTVPKKEDGNSDTSTDWGISIQLDEGNTYKNQFEVSSRHGYALKVLGGGGREVWIGGSLSQKSGDKTNPEPENYITRKNLTDALWIGSQAEYDAITNKSDDTLYVVM